MRIYLDHAATTKTDIKVVRIMQPYFTEKFGNASSIHKFGQEAREALERARETIAKSINAGTKEIIFTSGGTESDNQAIKEIAFTNQKKGNHIITSKIEHHAVTHTCELLENLGFKITYLNVDQHGIVDLEQLKKEITPKTILISIMHANNEIGTIQPIEEIGKICKKHNIYFHTDAVQTFGKLKIDVKKMNISLLSASAHKLYGPKGVGFLYVKKGTKIGQLLHGGGHEFGLRSGTENVSGIVGFAKAVELKQDNKKEIKLRDKLIKEILEKIPNSKLNGHPEKRLPNNAHFSFEFIEGESILLQLDDKGIAVSTGSACSSKELKPSQVLLAIGQKPEEAHGSIRMTLGRETTEKEIDFTIKTTIEAVEYLRKISPFGK